ncbi:ABC transporter permease [Virgibacillus doumboii]|uniref:ABC transporter permease n=1 Tax=Virgibacillus doumboii TaxID=2697503 RepID=UPI0013DED30F|nr:ABC transporter permease [Virgibacillus doumboii]
MIWQIVKKIGLTLLRNPTQLLLLVGLPIILIAILGAALGSVMNGEEATLNVKVAIVEHGDEEGQVNRFVNDLENSGLPKERVIAAREAAKQLTPIKMLKDSVFGSEGLKEIVQVENIKPSKLEKVLDDDSYTAVIEVPENFTYHTLQNFFGIENAEPSLKVYQNEGKQLGAPIILDVLQQFQEQLSLNSFVGQKGLSMEAIQVDTEAISGEIETINQREPVSAKNYYAIGMAVMNVLFLASAIGSYAFLEKKIHVFDRIILADVSRWVYFIGVFIAGTVFSFLHLLIVFSISWILFGVTWPNILAFLVVTFGLAIAVGGIAVLLTAISYRINSELITNFFSAFLISIIAFLGGSFFPIGELSETIQLLGNFTPNGAGMSAYLDVLRGNGISAVWEHVIFLSIFAVTLIIIAAFSFPKRGQTT